MLFSGYTRALEHEKLMLKSFGFIADDRGYYDRERRIQVFFMVIIEARTGEVFHHIDVEHHDASAAFSMFLGKVQQFTLDYRTWK